MKIPLRYQVTEYDCGTTSLENAITFLFEREEIPPSLIYSINKYTLDEFNTGGEESKGGTSTSAVKLLAHWINSFAKTRKFNISCQILDGQEVNLYTENAVECMNKRGVIVARVWLCLDEHYVIITAINNDTVHIFDPYYVDIKKYDNDSEIEIVKFRKLEYNRIVSLDRMMSGTTQDYSIVNNENRELLLINRTDRI